MSAQRHDAKKRERRAHRKERHVRHERRGEQSRRWKAAWDRRDRAANVASGIAFVVTVLVGYAAVHEYLPGYFRAMFPIHRLYGHTRHRDVLAILDAPIWIVAVVVSIVTWFAADSITHALKTRRTDPQPTTTTANDPPRRTETAAPAAPPANVVEPAPPVPESQSDRFAQLDRAGEDIASWRARLQQLFAHGEGYRDLPFSRDELRQLLTDATAPVERKIASALALRAASDADAERCIRASLESSKVPRVRAAFERMLTDRLDDDHIERAIEADPTFAERA